VKFEHLVYASSSSVYGANPKMPFSTHDNVDHPASLYVATKKAHELMAHTYSHLYNLTTTGLRFFLVYGPQSRPDMSLFMFIRNNNPVNLLTFIEILEKYLNKEAIKNFLPLQPGDVPDTYADVSGLVNKLGYKSATSLETGINNFVEWYRDFYKIGR
jgi:UDP-glucuronate 4-epimerase